MRASVVLPEPFGPSIATISPRRTLEVDVLDHRQRLPICERDTRAGESATGVAGGLCLKQTQALVYAGRLAASHSTASARGASSRMRPASTKSDPRRERERRRDAMLGEDDGRSEALDGGEEERRPRRDRAARSARRGAAGGLERERRREAHPLELAARELDRLPPPEVERVDRASAARRAARSRPAARRGSRARTRPRSRPRAITTWSSGSWKTVATVPASSPGACAACRARRPRRGRRSGRRGSAARARRGRGGASTSRSPTGRAARRPRPPRARARRRRAPARASGYAKREPLDGR